MEVGNYQESNISKQTIWHKLFLYSSSSLLQGQQLSYKGWSPLFVINQFNICIILQEDDGALLLYQGPYVCSHLHITLIKLDFVLIKILFHKLLKINTLILIQYCNTVLMPLCVQVIMVKVIKLKPLMWQLIGFTQSCSLVWCRVKKRNGVLEQQTTHCATSTKKEVGATSGWNVICVSVSVYCSTGRLSKHCTAVFCRSFCLWFLQEHFHPGPVEFNDIL